MSRIQFPCSECGSIVPVGMAQAGASLPCPACGKVLEIPGTKQLRTYPPVEASSAGSKGPSSRQRGAEGGSLLYRGLVASLLLVSFVGIGYGGYLSYLRWTAPINFGHSEEELYSELFDKSMADPPARVWDHWNYLVDSGLPNPDPPIYFVLSQAYEQQKPWMIGAWILGSIALIAFFALSVAGTRGTGRR